MKYDFDSALSLLALFIYMYNVKIQQQQNIK